MKTVCLLSILLLTTLTGTAQRLNRIKLYRVLINTSGGGLINGVLYELTDSTLRYVPNTANAIAQLRSGQANVLEIPVHQIEVFFINRRSHLARWVLRGFTTGFVVGGLGVLTTSKKGSYGRSLGGVGVAISSTTGALLGTVVNLLPRRQVRIDQQLDLYQSARQSVQKFSYQYRSESKQDKRR